MCGIVGILSPQGKVSPDEILRMRDAMVHRGPDDAGIWISPNQTVGLGHRRLSIIDLSSLGHQPMSNEKEDLWIVYNGETYNFKDVRSILEGHGYRFRSKTDSEVVLKAYAHWGVECLNYLSGIFAFAIWDERRKRLFCARDRLGVKPFFYWQGNRHEFAFASELKGLFGKQDFHEKIDMESLYYYLALRRVPAPRAILKNCATLSPGSYLIFDTNTGQVEIHSYWNPAQIATKERLNGDESDLRNQLHELLRDAVSSQLVSDVPVGAFLSGGIDSSSVVSLMTEVSSNVHTFSIGFEDQVDEAPYAKRVAEILGTRHEELYVSKQQLLDFIQELPKVCDQPLADSSLIPTYWLSRLTHQYVTVALSGDGGDELFGGYGHYSYINRWRAICRMPYALRRRLADLGDFLPSGKLQKAMNSLDFRTTGQLLGNFTGCWRPRELEKLLKCCPENRDTGPFEDGKPGLANRLMLNDLIHYMPDEILTKVDRASMAVSLETRVPVLDHRVVEFALRLPERMKIYKGVQKVILRDILGHYLPRGLIDRPKRGFGAPLDVWLRGELRWMINEYLDESKIRQQGFFDVDTVKATSAQFLEGKISHYRVWVLIVFQMWWERYCSSN